MNRSSLRLAFAGTLPRARGIATILTLTLAFLLGAPIAGAERYVIAAGGKENTARFDSKAPVESFSGTTHQVQGSIEVVPGALGDSITVTVEVDMASLDTGIALRNKHMRENHLETDRYPKSRFVGAKIRAPHPPSLTPDAAVTLTVEGNFELHGVTHRLRLPLEVTYATHDTPPALHVVGHFPVSLNDFSIKRPQFLALRIGEVQQVTVDVKAVLAN